jgi:hypothetical protein
MGGSDGPSHVRLGITCSSSTARSYWWRRPRGHLSVGGGDLSGVAPRYSLIKAVSVCGLGKLGACMAATLAARGFDVVGIDIDPEKVARHGFCES